MKTPTLEWVVIRNRKTKQVKLIPVRYTKERINDVKTYRKEKR